MKLLIAYDGSDYADAALDDLRHAGLPDVCQTTILSVVEFAPTPEEPREILATEEGIHEIHTLARQAEARLRLEFPAWRIRTQILRGLATVAVVKQAELQHPDLLILGCNGRSSRDRNYLGNVTRAVLESMPCSVRIGRRARQNGGEPLRLQVGYEDSDHARAAMEAVAARKWPANAEVHVISALETDALVHVSTGSFAEGTSMSDYELAKSVALDSLIQASLELKKVGLSRVPVLRVGEANQVLLDEAARLESDCIFLGAGHRARSVPVRLGEVAAEVATCANCSVEIVLSKIALKI